MTIPSGGNNPPISINDINSDAQDGYSLGTNLNAYRGKIYDDKAGGVGVFSSGPISLSDFYGKRRVDGSSRSVSSSGNQTVPPYRTLTIYVYGAGGGGGGGKGFLGYAFCAVANGGNGGAGNPSSVGSPGQAWYITAAAGDGGGGGGAGGAGANGAGADGNSPAGGAGGAGNNNANGSAGGSGGRTQITLTNPVLGGTGPVSGTAISFSLGSGGGGGGGSPGVGTAFPATCNFNGANGLTGGTGNTGYGGLVWTGTA